jgi:hypothetical protein
MFSRGNWAIIGLDKGTKPEFIASLGNPHLMFDKSQLLALALAAAHQSTTFGINPFSSPRLDEAGLSLEGQSALAAYVALDLEERPDHSTPNATHTLTQPCFAFGENAFAFKDTSVFNPADAGTYGFWLVGNEWKDVNHILSVKEEFSYKQMDRPYKFLDASGKKAVDEMAKSVQHVARKQFPVILDFTHGYVFVESTSKADLLLVSALLKGLGAKTFALTWDFGDVDWPSNTLTQLYANTSESASFLNHAQDVERMGGDTDLAQPNENVELRGILSKYFSTTEMESEAWASISAPATLQLNPPSPTVVTVGNQTTATKVLHMVSEASILSATITLENRDIRIRKGEETLYRKPYMSFELSSALMESDAGAVLFRSLDFPAYRKSILRQVKKTGEVPSIGEFWGSWTKELNLAIYEFVGLIVSQIENPSENLGLRPMFEDGEGTDLVLDGESQ